MVAALSPVSRNFAPAPASWNSALGLQPLPLGAGGDPKGGTKCRLRVVAKDGYLLNAILLSICSKEAGSGNPKREQSQAIDRELPIPECFTLHFLTGS